MSHDKNAVRKILDQAKAAGREALTAPEARGVCEAYGITIPKEGVASSADEAAKLAAGIGFPVVMKIVSPQILHKTEAGGVIVGVKSAEHAKEAYATIVGNARKYDAKAEILGVQVQQMLAGGQEVIIGAVTDPAFGKLVAFGLGGILVEVLKDITFRLAPASKEDALSMLDGIQAAEILRGVRGAKPVDRAALSGMIERVSALVADFPGNLGDGPQSGVCDRPRRDRRGRADRAQFQSGAAARPAEPGRNRREDEPHHEAEGGGGDRRLGRERQDRQFGDEEFDQWRLQRGDLSDPSQRRKHHGQESL